MDNVVNISENGFSHDEFEAEMISLCSDWAEDEVLQENMSGLYFTISEFLTIANLSFGDEDLLPLGMHLIWSHTEEWSAKNQKEVLSILASKMGFNAVFKEKEINNG